MDKDKGGRMACPGCGGTNYIYRGLGWKVYCSKCQKDWEYDDMLFVKEMSWKGRERIRRI